MKPGPCEHCGSPDRSKQCRYSWYLPYREDWKKSGADAPCYCDDYAEGEMRSDRALVRKVLVLLVLLLAVLACCKWMTRAHARDLGQWENSDPTIREWYQLLMQPDVPTASCCGESDAYWADEIHVRDGKTYATITDDRDDAPLHRPHVDLGTEIEIPNHKLKWDRSNPTGHGVVFLNRGGYVFCFVQPGGA